MTQYIPIRDYLKRFDVSDSTRKRMKKKILEQPYVVEVGGIKFVDTTLIAQDQPDVQEISDNVIQLVQKMKSA